jgi:Ni,Fe-hydrogenase III component G
MTTTDEVLEFARQLAQSWAWTLETRQPEPNRIDVQLQTAADLVPFVTGLRVKRLGWLSAITGLDLGPEAGELELLYHFTTGPAVVTLRLRLPRDQAKVPSLCDIIPSAESSEREIREMLGVTVEGLRNDLPIYLPDDWPEGVFPLRKDVHPAPVEPSLNGGQP